MDQVSSSTDLSARLKQRMSYLNQRSEVLAENVANASTPNYKARDLAPISFENTLKTNQIGMMVTDSKHIVPSSMAGVNAQTVLVKNGETVPTGNSVDLEQEMLKVSQTAIEHQTVAAAYKKISNLFRIAVKGGSAQ